MKFWDAHSIALLRLRQEIISITEEFEGKNDIHSPNYHRKLNAIINKKLGEKSKILANLSMIQSIHGLSI